MSVCRKTIEVLRSCAEKYLDRTNTSVDHNHNYNNFNFTSDIIHLKYINKLMLPLSEY